MHNEEGFSPERMYRALGLRIGVKNRAKGWVQFLPSGFYRRFEGKETAPKKPSGERPFPPLLLPVCTSLRHVTTQDIPLVRARFPALRLETLSVPCDISKPTPSTNHTGSKLRTGPNKRWTRDFAKSRQGIFKPNTLQLKKDPNKRTDPRIRIYSTKNRTSVRLIEGGVYDPVRPRCLRKRWSYQKVA